MLIAASGDAETQVVQEAADAWAQESGNKVKVVVAQDINQELSQGFASSSPPDVFYVDAGVFADYAANENLYPYADQVESVDDFYPTLRETFTLDGTEYCVPKDFSTLALQINTKSWKAAGLTDADIPTTWDELADVAGKLTTKDQVGLAIGPGRDRAGAFLVQNGGFWVDGESGEVTADAESNVEALQYVQDLLASGDAAFPASLDAGWGGEAFGVMPSRQAAEADYVDQFPKDAPFIAGGDYAQGPVNLPGMGPALADLDSQIEQLETADVSTILESFQTNAAAALQQ